MDICILNGVKYFPREDGSQDNFAFHSVMKYFKPLTNDTVAAWKPKILLDQSVKPLDTSDNSLHPRLQFQP